MPSCRSRKTGNYLDWYKKKQLPQKVSETSRGIFLGLRCASQKGENLTQRQARSCGYYLFPLFLPNSFLMRFDLVFFTDPPCLIYES